MSGITRHPLRHKLNKCCNIAIHGPDADTLAERIAIARRPRIDVISFVKIVQRCLLSTTFCTSNANDSNFGEHFPYKFVRTLCRTDLVKLPACAGFFPYLRLSFGNLSPPTIVMIYDASSDQLLTDHCRQFQST